VYDKTGLTGLAQALADSGAELVSTGSTAATLEAAGLAVTRVEQLTEFPECLDGRVKTLHPRVHAGLLADLRLDSHVTQLADLGIEPFDLLVSNLYPFRESVAAGADFDGCVEQIDIGGPAMVRAAAKNHASVAVVTSPAAYDVVREALAAGGFTLAQRRKLAADAFVEIAAYDIAVAEWFAANETTEDSGGWPAFAGLGLRHTTTLRYGENPHQAAAVYVDPAHPVGLAQAEQLGGKEMSYNNFVDADAAWRTVHDFSDPCVAIIKHANPCGIAVGADIAEAHRKAHACDPVSAFGGVIAANRPVTGAMAAQLDGIFTEVIVAPAFEPEALAVLTAKKNLRVLAAPDWQPLPAEWRQISGGVLVQMADRLSADGDAVSAWQLAAGSPLDEQTLADLAFAWKAVRAVKSNAILLAHDGASVGVGMGQVNRVDSARLAVVRAGDRAVGSVAASDAFFPFPDGFLVLAAAGVRAVVQPGGSVRDDEVIAAAQEAGVTMYLTGTRHFYH
jgi:phosphoribosylaminoimidazolecarboxamide formyltransferase/IMP cyclohydrolase